jgi:hypothetical protein
MTYPIHGLFVGAGIDQQPRAARVTIFSGPHERRQSVLRIIFDAANIAPTSYLKEQNNGTG